MPGPNSNNKLNSVPPHKHKMTDRGNTIQPMANVSVNPK